MTVILPCLAKRPYNCIQGDFEKNGRNARYSEHAVKLPLLFMFDIYIIIKLSKLNFI